MTSKLLLAALVPAAWAAAVVADQPPKLGAIASQNKICSKIGTDLLLKGGNAVDAMVGTVLCVGTVSMYHSGIGGGGFALVRDANGHYEAVDFRESAPAAAFEEMYRGNFDGSVFGGLASGVPGELRGLEYMHGKYGKLSWSDVVLPAARVASDGFPVNADLVEAMDSVEPNDFLTKDPNWAMDFAPNGHRVKLGETMTRKRYAKTLETIADKGATAFYFGDVAASTIRALRASNGTMTLQDLETYEVKSREVVSGQYKDYKLTTVGVPASGVAVLSALNILSGYKYFGNIGYDLLSTHRLDEGMKFAYGQRTRLGDPSYVTGMTEFTAYMVNPATGSEIRGKISDVRTYNSTYYDPPKIITDDTPGTSHMVAADASGMAVSLTTTVNLLFGSLLMVPETGIIMNNQMDDFSIPGKNNSFGYVPNPANYIVAGKRPLSSSSPVIVETAGGRFYYAIGAAGGSRIISSTLQNILHVLGSGRTVPDALAQPRLHDQILPATTMLENSYNTLAAEYLASLGHNVSFVEPRYSAAQGLRLLPNGTFEAAGEPRQLDSGGYAV